MFSATPSPSTPAPREPKPGFALTPESVDSLSELVRELRDTFGEDRPPALRHLARALAPWPRAIREGRDEASEN